MSWKQVLAALAIALVLTGPIAFVVHQDLVRRFGKHLSDRPLGRGVSIQHYAVDSRARRRARIGTLIFFLIAAPLCFCLWIWAFKNGLPGF
jgi:hypothetical protein